MSERIGSIGQKPIEIRYRGGVGYGKKTIKIVREDGIIPYDSLSEQEKAEFGKRLNQRAIEAVAKAHGYTVDFLDDPPDTVTA